MRHYYASNTVKSTDQLLACLVAIIEAIDGLFLVRGLPRTSQSAGNLLVSVQRNMWSRAARRRRGKESPHIASESSLPIILICEIDLVTPGEASDNYALIGSWRKGRSRGDFESFWSHITRKVVSALAD